MQLPENPFQTGSNRYRAEPGRRFGTANHQFTIDQQRLAQLVGIAAFALPVILWASTRIDAFCFYDTISHFYYAPYTGGIFVITLAIIATILIAYRGESDEENLIANLAGVFAFIAAFVPTSGSGCEAAGNYLARPIGSWDGTGFSFSAPFDLFNGGALIHAVSAGILFGFLGWYALFIFTRIDPDEHVRDDGTLKPEKQRRNRIYVWTGRIIWACVATLAVKAAADFFGLVPFWWDRFNTTFWLEALALWAFGYGWVTKGRMFARDMDARDRAVREMAG